MDAPAVRSQLVFIILWRRTTGGTIEEGAAVAVHLPDVDEFLIERHRVAFGLPTLTIIANAPRRGLSRY
jgi:hypothetical protein